MLLNNSFRNIAVTVQIKTMALKTITKQIKLQDIFIPGFYRSHMQGIFFGDMTADPFSGLSLSEFEECKENPLLIQQKENMTDFFELLKPLDKDTIVEHIRICLHKYILQNQSKVTKGAISNKKIKTRKTLKEIVWKTCELWDTTQKKHMLDAIRQYNGWRRDDMPAEYAGDIIMRLNCRGQCPVLSDVQAGLSQYSGNEFACIMVTLLRLVDESSRFPMFILLLQSKYRRTVQSTAQVKISCNNILSFAKGLEKIETDSRVWRYFTKAKDIWTMMIIYVQDTQRKNEITYETY